MSAHSRYHRIRVLTDVMGSFTAPSSPPPPPHDPTVDYYLPLLHAQGVNGYASFDDGGAWAYQSGSPGIPGSGGRYAGKSTSTPVATWTRLRLGALASGVQSINKFSVSWWFKTPGSSESHGEDEWWIDYNNTQVRVLSIILKSSGDRIDKIRFLPGSVNGAPTFASAFFLDHDIAGGLPPSTWHHIAFTINGNLVKVYLDGEIVISHTCLGATPLLSGSNYYNEMEFAVNYGGSKTTVDEVATWTSHVLTQEEVTAQYRTGLNL